MSYGYEPRKQEKAGSWSEVFLITRVVFGMLMPFALGLIGVIVFFVVVILLVGQQPLLGLIPFALAAAVAVWVLRKERRKADEEAARIRGD